VAVSKDAKETVPAGCGMWLHVRSRHLIETLNWTRHSGSWLKKWLNWNNRILPWL